MSRAAIPGPRKGVRTAVALPAVAAASVLLLAACGGGGSSGNSAQGTSTPQGTSSPQGTASAGTPDPQDKNTGQEKNQAPVPDPDGARVTVDPANKATGIEPGKAITVTAADGVLTRVRISGTDGGTVRGSLSADGLTWTSSGKTVPGSVYTVSVDSRSATGKDGSSTSTFTTAKADRINKLAMKPADGGTFGVAQPVSITFDYPVVDKAEVERHLNVTASVPTEGSWGWIKDITGKDRVDWRPKEYWKPGTKVTLNADLTGVKSGKGTYFARDYASTFTVGTGRVVEVDVPNHKVKVIENGETVKTLAMSAGSDEFPTRGGTHVILGKNATETLDSQTVGLGDSYKLPDVPWVVHFTSSGTFFHSAAWNTANIGVDNTSHGCVGMTVEDAKWFYERVQVGDPVVVKGSNSTATTDPGNGFGAWQLSYAQWQAKSALK
ncbi:Ig-like domain-containing protein [Yinghuangia aomiensis]|uniref:Ig-like domain-containing protein n=1 Tax=Yinghuangia aomiensis TaxID=676205 RepID=A0ABP9HMA9_9ACTN